MFTLHNVLHGNDVTNNIHTHAVVDCYDTGQAEIVLHVELCTSVYANVGITCLLPPITCSLAISVLSSNGVGSRDVAACSIQGDKASYY